MALDFLLVEPEWADPFLMEMDYSNLAEPVVFQMEMGEFDHFEPLWKFLRTQGAEADFSKDFLLLPLQIVAARDKMNSLWPDIQRTRQFFHVDDDPFWMMRDLLEQVAASGSGLLALCD